MVESIGKIPREDALELSVLYPKYSKDYHPYHEDLSLLKRKKEESLVEADVYNIFKNIKKDEEFINYLRSLNNVNKVEFSLKDNLSEFLLKNEAHAFVEYYLCPINRATFYSNSDSFISNIYWRGIEIEYRTDIKIEKENNEKYLYYSYLESEALNKVLDKYHIGRTEPVCVEMQIVGWSYLKQKKIRSKKIDIWIEGNEKH